MEVGEPPVRLDLAAHKGAALVLYLAASTRGGPTSHLLAPGRISLLWEESDEHEVATA